MKIPRHSSGKSSIHGPRVHVLVCASLRACLFCSNTSDFSTSCMQPQAVCRHLFGDSAIGKSALFSIIHHVLYVHKYMRSKTPYHFHNIVTNLGSAIFTQFVSTLCFCNRGGVVWSFKIEDFQTLSSKPSNPGSAVFTRKLNISTLVKLF